MGRQIDRKYQVNDSGNITKTSDGTIIPRDEPLILFRARDQLAVPMMIHYAELCETARCDPGQLELLHRRIADFLGWQREHPAAMHLPASEPGDDYR